MAVVKVVQDPAVPRDDTYRRSTIHTRPGEPANSVSKPTPREKQVAARPVTKSKLLGLGGPGGGSSKLSGRPAAAAKPMLTFRPLPGGSQFAAQPRIVPQPVAAAAASHIHN
ncbi:hypothetical protein POSPLADRAFT_1035359 [Postia placenta MAD-698-R-SB12]|uniref:Uncharacterized protein n=1 Tax=Postia placenta MAD-698-R-SB12 TaxID=670580 RepID=A0A1X6MTW7_9APHY|nr:hypothetical protein POSPLADRAFT_1035359 [Postia placenta MAD-698-R-SB12]OSX59831.1 hypothetical protein POSPLADRAFT_1035359 [Postia placenta MAD-698-R-SB12]